MNRVTVNGVSVEVPRGSSISVINGQVYIDDNPLGNSEPKVNQVVIEGDAYMVHAEQADVQVKGSVRGDVKADGNVTCGAVGRDVNAGHNVTCDGVSGSVDAGYNVMCGRVGGSVKAGNNIIGG